MQLTPVYEKIGSRHIDESRLTRRYQRTQEYDCRGKIQGFINRRHNWIQLNVYHHMNHPTPAAAERRMVRSTPISDDVRRFIASRLHLYDLNATGLWEQVLEHAGGYVVNKGQVLNAWRDLHQERYRKHDDQLLSARILVDELNDPARGDSIGESLHCEEVRKGFCETIVVGWMWWEIRYIS